MTARTDGIKTRQGATPWLAGLVVALLIAMVWGAWRLGVFVGNGVDGARWSPWSALKGMPRPPPTLPTQRRPTVQPR